jgi:hypothetical protein
MLTAVAVWLGALVWFGPEAVIMLTPLMLAIPLAEFFCYGWDSRIALGYALVGLCLPFLWLPINAFDPPRHPNASGACRNNLKWLQLSLLNYQDVHGSFPPLVTYDDQGQPMHSWRANLLTQLERPDLAAAYDWSEPWNGPRNRKLHAENLRVFDCPLDARHKECETSYLAIAITDGTPALRFAVVEIHGSGIHFLEPRDVTLEEIDRGSSTDGRISLLAMHGGGSYLHVLWPDGEIERVTTNELRERIAKHFPPQPEPPRN